VRKISLLCGWPSTKKNWNRSDVSLLLQVAEIFSMQALSKGLKRRVLLQ
jgi:hypothetical protein